MAEAEAGAGEATTSPPPESARASSTASKSRKAAPTLGCAAGSRGLSISSRPLACAPAGD
eukprot:1179807-Prorocentrum_minimum.AAC.1